MREALKEERKGEKQGRERRRDRDMGDGGVARQRQRGKKGGAARQRQRGKKGGAARQRQRGAERERERERESGGGGGAFMCNTLTLCNPTTSNTRSSSITRSQNSPYDIHMRHLRHLWDTHKENLIFPPRRIPASELGDIYRSHIERLEQMFAELLTAHKRLKRGQTRSQ